MSQDINMNHFEVKQGHPQQDPSVNSISLVNVTSNHTGQQPSGGPVLDQGQGNSGTQNNSKSGGFRSLSHHQKNLKPRPSKCVRLFLCTPSKLYLIATICLTALASFLLSYSLTSEYWEVMVYNSQKVVELIERNETLSTQLTLSWILNGQVPKITMDKDKERSRPEQILFLLPIRSGVWTSCIDITPIEYEELKGLGYEKPHCVDHLQNIVRPIETRASWQHRMQNLGIACATVCLILLGAAVLVGLFGVLRPQISAVLVTGVIYMLAALFAIFTLAIVHLKHKNRKENEPLDVWTRLIPAGDPKMVDEFQSTRLIHQGWSLFLAWIGNCVCILASVMWVILSKIMRYNPNPLLL